MIDAKEPLAKEQCSNPHLQLRYSHEDHGMCMYFLPYLIGVWNNYHWIAGLLGEYLHQISKGFKSLTWWGFRLEISLKHPKNHLNTWRFPKIGVPPNHPFSWDFPWNKPSIWNHQSGRSEGALSSSRSPCPRRLLCSVSLIQHWKSLGSSRPWLTGAKRRERGSWVWIVINYRSFPLFPTCSTSKCQ